MEEIYSDEKEIDEKCKAYSSRILDKPKYYKNHHLFIDPFELTIAQWCYAHMWNTKESAITNLGEKFTEIESSYWKYVMTYEKDEWEQLKEQSRNDARFSKINIDDDEDFTNGLIVNRKYNPLEDTRPYYYASYEDIRSVGNTYQELMSGATYAENYVFDSNLGDEYQNIININDTTSFMGILNSRVVLKTGKRIYDDEKPEGVVWFNQFKVDKLEQDCQNVYNDPHLTNPYDEKTKKKEHDFWEIYKQMGMDKVPYDKNRWGMGIDVGINFDLPTEAQWEYCCRMPSPNSNKDEYVTTPAYPSQNLGYNFEE